MGGIDFVNTSKSVGESVTENRMQKFANVRLFAKTYTDGLQYSRSFAYSTDTISFYTTLIRPLIL